MSFHAVEWALGLDGLKPVTKAVLVALCRHENGGQCFPSLSRLTKVSGFSRNTVITHLKILEAAGIITRIKKRMEDASYDVSITKINMSPPSVRPALPSAADASPRSAEDGRGVEQAMHPNTVTIISNNIRFGKIEDLLEEIASAENPIGKWREVLSELEILTPINGAPLENSAETPLISSKLGEGDIQKLSSKMTSNDWIELNILPIERLPKFEYRAREGEYIPFEDASAGQQATALLWALLNQDPWLLTALEIARAIDELDLGR